MASVLAVAGLVVFATEASAHNNYVTPTASCASPLGSGATISWLITNDYNETETGTASVTGGGLNSTTFSINASPNYPSNVSTTTLTQTISASELATLLGSNPNVTFSWNATWHPDGYSTSGTQQYNLSNLPNGCVPQKVTPTLTTTANPSSGSIGGAALSDSATLSGGNSPSGTITFYLFNPSQSCTTWPSTGQYTFSQTFPVSGNGTYGPTTGGPSPNAQGTWHWLTVYSGDANNYGTNSGCTTEPVTIGQESPSVNTVANPTSATIGSSTALSDSATLSGGYDPSGTITFYLFNPNQACSTWPSTGQYAFSQTFPVSGNGTYGPTTGGPVPTIVGTWQWIAVYSGDANNKGANSGCGSEPVSVTPATPSVNTTANPTTATVGDSTTLSDSATLSGGYKPGGTITFYLFKPNQTCTATPAPGSYAFSQQFTVSGNGAYGPTTGGPTPTSAGTWQWIVVYSGDANNSGANSGCGSEPVAVSTHSNVVTTVASPTSATVGGSTALSDSATLSGGYNPSGTVTFYLFDPSQTCTATPAPGSYAFSQSFPVDGNGTYGPTTGGPTPTSAGTWQWIVVYSGDANNSGSNSGCGSEPVTVGQQSPSVDTSANPTSEAAGAGPLSDSAALSGGYNPSGTVTFYLFDPSQTCTATPAVGTYAFSQSFPVDGNGTYGPTIGGPVPEIKGTWQWVAVYSGDANNKGADSGCGSEPVTIKKATPSVDTSATPTTVTVGDATTLSDSAALRGGANPGGTITFYLFKPNQTCSATPSTGTYAFSQSFTVDGNGTYGPTTGGPAPDKAGTWQWIAVYSGDANNKSADSGCGSEPVTVKPATPSVVTTLVAPESTKVGNSWNDSATVTGNPGGGAPRGSVSFSVCTVTSPATSCTGGTVVGTVASPSSTNGDASSYNLPSADAYTPPNIGTYCYNATYTPATKDNYTTAVGAPECFTVTAADPQFGTQQSGSVSGSGTVVIGSSITDTATVTGNPVGGVPGGTVSFTECDTGSAPAVCPEGNPVGSAVTLQGSGDSSSATSAAFTPTATGYYCFAAAYTPGPNSNYLAAEDNMSGDVQASECFLVTTPNFTVTKTNVPGNGKPVAPGSTIPYTVTIQNVGNGAGSATVTDDVPSSLTVQGTPACAVTAPDTCTVTNTTGSTWTFTVALAPGDTATVTFSAKLSATDSADVVNTATITSGICNPNLPPSGGQSGTVQCSSTVTNPVPDFTVTKTNVPSTGTSVAPGSTIDYTIAIKNVGDGAGSATVTDAVPSSLTVQGTPACAVTAPDTCTVTNTTGSTWTFAVNLAAGDTATVTFATTVGASATGTITNTATITTGPCNTSSGCSSTVSNPVTPVSTGPSTVTPTTTPTTTPTSPSTTSAIAFTGALLSQEWLIGLGALVLGAGLVLVARRRRRNPKQAGE